MLRKIAARTAIGLAFAIGLVLADGVRGAEWPNLPAGGLRADGPQWPNIPTGGLRADGPQQPNIPAGGLRTDGPQWPNLSGAPSAASTAPSSGTIQTTAATPNPRLNPAAPRVPDVATTAASLDPPRPAYFAPRPAPTFTERIDPAFSGELGLRYWFSWSQSSKDLYGLSRGSRFAAEL